METLSSRDDYDVRLKQSYCPECQYPFKSLKVKSPSKHISKCKKSKILAEKECADGISCISLMEVHYLLYSHKVLSEYRSSRNGIPTFHASSTAPPPTVSSSHQRSDEPFVKIDPVTHELPRFPLAFVDLTDSQTSSEEFKPTQSSSKNGLNLLMRASQATTSRLSNNSSSTRGTLGKHKLKSSLSQKNSVPTQNSTVKRLKRTPNKKANSTLIVEKPNTDNPWTITASQLQKLKTPLKKFQIKNKFHPLDDDIIDLTQDDECQAATSVNPNTKSPQRKSPRKKSVPEVTHPTSLNENIVKIKPKARRALLTPTGDSSFLQNPSQCQTSQLKKFPVIKIERIHYDIGQSHGCQTVSLSTSERNEKNSNLEGSVTNQNTASCDKVTSKPVQLANSRDKVQDTSSAKSKPQDPPFQSTQVSNLKDKSQTTLPSSAETQDSADWVLPPPSGPGFAPCSPIKFDPSLTRALHMDTDGDDFFSALSDSEPDTAFRQKSNVPDENDNFVKNTTKTTNKHIQNGSKQHIGENVNSVLSKVLGSTSKYAESLCPEKASDTDVKSSDRQSTSKDRLSSSEMRNHGGDESNDRPSTCKDRLSSSEMRNHGGDESNDRPSTSKDGLSSSEMRNHGGDESNDRPSTSKDRLSSSEMRNHGGDESNDRPSTSKDGLSSSEMRNHGGDESNDRPSTSKDRLSSSEMNHGGDKSNDRPSTSKDGLSSSEMRNHGGDESNDRPSTSKDRLSSSEMRNHGGDESNDRPSTSKDRLSSSEMRNHGGYESNDRQSTSKYRLSSSEMRNHGGDESNDRQSTSKDGLSSSETRNHGGMESNQRPSTSKDRFSSSETRNHGGMESDQRPSTSKDRLSSSETRNHGGMESNQRLSTSKDRLSSSETRNHGGMESDQRPSTSKDRLSSSETRNHGGMESNQRPSSSKDGLSSSETRNHGGMESNQRPSTSKDGLSSSEMRNHGGYESNQKASTSNHGETSNLKCNAEKSSLLQNFDATADSDSLECSLLVGLTEKQTQPYSLKTPTPMIFLKNKQQTAKAMKISPPKSSFAALSKNLHQIIKELNKVPTASPTAIKTLTVSEPSPNIGNTTQNKVPPDFATNHVPVLVADTLTPTTGLPTASNDSPTIPNAPNSSPTIPHAPKCSPIMTNAPNGSSTMPHAPNCSPTVTHALNNSPSTSHAPNGSPTKPHTSSGSPTTSCILPSQCPPAPVTKFPDSDLTLNAKKQGDIGSMLFGMKPKTKVETKADKTNDNGGRARKYGYYGGFNGTRKCPFYKKVSGTNIAVDAFSYGVVEGIRFYFLSHFHSDHYMGLNKKTWKEKVYCGKVTGNLVAQKLGLAEDLIVRLPIWEEIQVGDVKVTLLEANHCPGAVLFLFKLRNNRVILHTGDFRAQPEMEEYKALQGARIDTLYLDTTYLNPNYRFPLQHDVINTAISIATDEIRECPKTLFVIGTYLIGKERIFAAIAKAIESRVFVAADKFRTIQCLEDKELSGMVTKKPDGARVHVVAMRALNAEDLKSRLSKFCQFQRIVAIRPTGWTHNSGHPDLSRIKPVVSGSIRIYGLPYSEHSSFEDLRRFVKYLRPSKIIPTVNVGRKETRDQMNMYLDKWKIGLDP